MRASLSLLVLTLFFSAKSFALDPLAGTFGSCVGDSAFIHDVDTALVGGTWSSSDPAVATVAAYGGFAEAMVTGISAGTAVITYSYGGSYVTAVFTVSPAPAPITGTTSICVGTSSALSDAVPGGTWSSLDPSDASIGSATGIVTAIAPGGYIQICYTMGTGCLAITTFTVNATYTGEIEGPTEVCLGSTITVSSTDSLMTGTWSSSNPSTATIGTSGIVTGAAIGTVTISYTATGVCGLASATKTITVSNTTDPGTISGPTGIDVGATGTFTESIPGGTWSIMAPSIASIGSSTGLVSGLNTGTDIITYNVSGCGGVTTTVAPVSILAFDGISGHVLFTGPATGEDVTIWLIHFDPSSNLLTAIDSETAPFNASGVYYQFLGLATDSFRVKASVSHYDSITTGYIPTYHTSNFYWHDAAVLGHTAGSFDINEDINMAYGAVTIGPGFIAGNVLSGANKGTSGGVATAGLSVCLINSTTSQIMQQTYTNSSGDYSFSNLPVGQTYKVFPDSLNFYTTPYSGITLTSSTPSMSSANFGVHTVSKTILPIVTGIQNLNSTVSSVTAFPNPTSGKLNIQWTETVSEKGTVVISDITGRDVYSTTLNMTQGTGTSEVDLSTLTSGTYLISLKSGTINYNDKIELAH